MKVAGNPTLRECRLRPEDRNEDSERNDRYPKHPSVSSRPVRGEHALAAMQGRCSRMRSMGRYARAPTPAKLARIHKKVAGAKQRADIVSLRFTAVRARGSVTCDGRLSSRRDEA